MIIVEATAACGPLIPFVTTTKPGRLIRFKDPMLCPPAAEPPTDLRHRPSGKASRATINEVGL